MADILKTEVASREQDPRQVHDDRTAEITASDRQKVRNAVTKDWLKASVIARRAGLNFCRTKAALDFLLAGKIIERQVIPPKSTLPAWKGGGTMSVQYEYRLTQPVLTVTTTEPPPTSAAPGG